MQPMTARNLRRCSSTVSTTSTTSVLQDLRSRILQDKLCQKFNNNDIARITLENWWLMKFLSNCQYDPDITYSVVIECLRWRTNFEIEHLSILELKPYLEQQLIYIHGKDHMENPLLWISYQILNNSNNTVEQLLIFWIDNYFMGTKASSPLNIIIDMYGSKMKHMDLNVMKFLLRATKYYYPGLVQDILIYESPTILNAPWKVVRSWLEQGHPKIHHVTKESVTDFIDTQYLKPYQGGSDNFIFTMSEIVNCLPSPQTPITVDGINDGIVNGDVHKPNLDDFALRRRSVKFDEDTSRAIPLTLPRRPSRGPGRRNSYPPSLKPLIEKRMNANENEWLINPLISISPKDELTLCRVDGETDYIDVIIIRNNSDKGQLFKVKVTGPEKFRVRPTSGYLKPKTSEIVRVHLQNEYKYSVSKEKIMLLLLTTEDASPEKFGELWKEADPEDKFEHKLKCKVFDTAEDLANGKPERRSSLLTTQQETIDELKETVRTMTSIQQIMIVVLCVLFALLVIIIMYENSNYSDLRARIDTMSNAILARKNEGERIKLHIDDDL